MGATETRRDTMSRNANRKEIENSTYCQDAARFIRGAGIRASYDADALADLMAIRNAVELAERKAVADLRADGWSWGEIADRVGMTRQACQQRWGKDLKKTFWKGVPGFLRTHLEKTFSDERWTDAKERFADKWGF